MEHQMSPSGLCMYTGLCVPHTCIYTKHTHTKHNTHINKYKNKIKPKFFFKKKKSESSARLYAKLQHETQSTQNLSWGSQSEESGHLSRSHKYAIITVGKGSCEPKHWDFTSTRVDENIFHEKGVIWLLLWGGWKNRRKSSRRKEKIHTAPQD